MTAGIGKSSNFRPRSRRACHTFNHLPPDDPKRSEILAGVVSGYNPYVFVKSDFRCVFGKNIHFKGMAILNFNCTLLDSNIIAIGDRTPDRGRAATSSAPTTRSTRRRGCAACSTTAPIAIGDRVWIGANVTILPGVTIGMRRSLGAGSVVTKDIPAGVVAVGNPCRVLRKITPQDRLSLQPNAAGV